MKRRTFFALTNYNKKRWKKKIGYFPFESFKTDSSLTICCLLLTYTLTNSLKSQNTIKSRPDNYNVSNAKVGALY